MSDKESVYVILEDCKYGTGKTERKVTIYSNYAIAKERYEKLKEQYKIYYNEYHTHDLKFNETINDKGEYIELEAGDSYNDNHFNITVFKEKINKGEHENE